MKFLRERGSNAAHIQEHDRVGTPLRVSLCGKAVNVQHCDVLATYTDVCPECQALLVFVHDEATATVEVAEP